MSGPHADIKTVTFCKYVKDEKDQDSSKNYVTCGMAEKIVDVYSSRRLGGIQDHFKHEGQFTSRAASPPPRAIEYILSKVSEGTAWRHDWNLHGRELGSTV